MAQSARAGYQSAKRIGSPTSPKRASQLEGTLPMVKGQVARTTAQTLPSQRWIKPAS